MESREEIQSLKLDVGLIKKDIAIAEKQCVQVSTKVSESIEKIQEVNANLVKMITIHEQKHEQHEKIEDGLKGDIKELHTRITTVNKEFHEKMEHIEQSITKKIDDFTKKIDEWKATTIENPEPVETKENRNLIGILSDFDRWRWMIVGAAATLGWILGHVNIQDFLHLLK